jgi:hypothetical protein
MNNTQKKLCERIGQISDYVKQAHKAAIKASESAVARCDIDTATLAVQAATLAVSAGRMLDALQCEALLDKIVVANTASNGGN